MILPPTVWFTLLHDNVTGLPKTYYWQPGMKSIKEKP
jgi:hypothetical protein